MSFKSVKFKNTKINIIDGDRGENYPSQNEYLDCLLYTSDAADE